MGGSDNKPSLTHRLIKHRGHLQILSGANDVSNLIRIEKPQILLSITIEELKPRHCPIKDSLNTAVAHRIFLRYRLEELLSLFLVVLPDQSICIYSTAIAR